MPTADVDMRNVLPEGTSRSRRAPLAPDGGPVTAHFPASRPARRGTSTLNTPPNPSQPASPDAPGPLEPTSMPIESATAHIEPVSTTQIMSEAATEELVLPSFDDIQTFVSQLPVNPYGRSVHNTRIEAALYGEPAPTAPPPPSRPHSVLSVHSTDSMPPLMSPVSSREQSPMDNSPPVSRPSTVRAEDIFEPPRLNEQGIVGPFAWSYTWN